MRHNKNARTFALITDESVPRGLNGRIRLCHFCQRNTWRAGGFILLLAGDLFHQARRRQVADKIAATKGEQG